MFITKYRPVNQTEAFGSRFDALLKDCQGKEIGLSVFSPVINTRDGEYAYHVDVDLPGVKKEDIKISVKGNMAIISGERAHKKEVEEDDYHRIESSFGKFERTFTLPEGSDAENITASSEDGVLEVIIPKLQSETDKVRKIEVK